MMITRWCAALAASALLAAPAGAAAQLLPPVDAQYTEPVAGVASPPEVPATPAAPVPPAQPAQPAQPAAPAQPATPTQPTVPGDAAAGSESPSPGPAAEATQGVAEEPAGEEPRVVHMPAGLGTLPFTGAELALIGLAGLVLAASGVALRHAAR